ncbi:MAG: alcohol dehydrogenase catalytic domain-containing protein [Desulfobacterales bacterium]|nr:alcohol dehydrogenase catalytic domain-containing protein [Desulfobacterales bacterium]
MKVAVWYNNADIRIKEAPRPKPGFGEMLVKVISCGICGSDIVEWYRLPRAPLVQGHEIGAEVAEVGNGVSMYAPGDRVFIAPKVPCLKCSYCQSGQYPLCSNVKERLPGGFAEYVLVPESLVEKGTYRLPDHMTHDQSTFIEPLACVIRAQRLAELRKNQTVMVMGSGMSGLLHVKLAKTKNCRVIATDINPQKLAYADNMGADMTLDAADDVPARLAAENPHKADAVFLCTSAMGAVDQAWDCVAKGGVIVFFAVPHPDKKVTIPINRFWMRETRIITSYYCGPPDIDAAINLIETQAVEVDDLITRQLPLHEIADGFRMVMGDPASLKVIVKPHL